MNDYSAWLDGLLTQLGRCGPQGQDALQLLVARRVKVTLHDQPTAARWTWRGDIQLHPRYVESATDDPYPLSLIVHEARHLEQGFFTALSVYGELDAWRIQFGLIKSLAGQYHADAPRDWIISKMMSLGLNWDRGLLASARDLMRDYAGKNYRVDLLPLYPLPREILFHITRKEPI
jgi:hypothetical protein